MNRILIAGGDMRFIYLARLLKQKGCEVAVKGISNSLMQNSSLSLGEEAKKADAVILPIPYTTDGITVNTPGSDQCLYLGEIYDNVRDDTMIFAGVVGEKQYNRPENFFDYGKREDFAIRNAVPTAEGAIEAAMGHMPVTIFESNALITGFGRCAKVLSLILKSMGARVTICARKTGDLAMAQALGMKGIHIGKMGNVLGDADVIFNTVPHRIFQKDELLKIKKNCPLTDIASLPGGADSAMAKALGINYLFLPGLPGKYSPLTGAQIICKTIENILFETGREGMWWSLKEKE